LPLLLKTLTTEHGTPLCRAKRHCRLLAAVGAGSASLSFDMVLAVRRRAQDRHSLALAALAPLGFVLELLVVEEQLFTSCEDKIRSTVNALQNLVLEFHWRATPITPCSTREIRNGEGSGSQRGQGIYIPSNCPWTRPTMPTRMVTANKCWVMLWMK
jgi:hypothetical protein